MFFLRLKLPLKYYTKFNVLLNFIALVLLCKLKVLKAFLEEVEDPFPLRGVCQVTEASQW